MRPAQTISRKDLDREKLGYFIAGFVEGEGSFNVSLRKKIDYKVNWQIVLSFNVSQKDPSILFIIKKELGCGIIKTRRDGLHSLDITNSQEIVEKVIPYFLEFPLLSKSKINNFNIFCKISMLVKSGEHREINGLKEILLLRENLNEGKGRTRKYGYNDIFSNQGILRDYTLNSRFNRDDDIVRPRKRLRDSVKPEQAPNHSVRGK